MTSLACVLTSDTFASLQQEEQRALAALLPACDQQKLSFPGKEKREGRGEGRGEGGEGGEEGRGGRGGEGGRGGRGGGREGYDSIFRSPQMVYAMDHYLRLLEAGLLEREANSEWMPSHLKRQFKSRGEGGGGGGETFPTLFFPQIGPVSFGENVPNKLLGLDP